MTEFDETQQREILLAVPHKVEQRRSLSGVEFQWRRAMGSTLAVGGGATAALLMTVLGAVGAFALGLSAIGDPSVAGTALVPLGLCTAVLVAGVSTLWFATRRPLAKLTLSVAGLRVDDGPVVSYGPSLALEFLLHDGSGVARASREVMEANRAELVKGSASSGLDAIIGGKRIAIARRITTDQALVLADAIHANWPKQLPKAAEQDQNNSTELRALHRLRAKAERS